MQSANYRKHFKYRFNNLFLQDLYGKDVGATEKHLPSRIEKAAKHHSMPFSPSAQKAKNVRTVVQVNSILHIYSLIIYCSDTIYNTVDYGQYNWIGILQLDACSLSKNAPTFNLLTDQGVAGVCHKLDGQQLTVLSVLFFVSATSMVFLSLKI